MLPPLLMEAACFIWDRRQRASCGMGKTLMARPPAVDLITIVAGTDGWPSSVMDGPDVAGPPACPPSCLSSCPHPAYMPPASPPVTARLPVHLRAVQPACVQWTTATRLALATHPPCLPARTHLCQPAVPASATRRQPRSASASHLFISASSHQLRTRSIKIRPCRCSGSDLRLPPMGFRGRRRRCLVGEGGVGWQWASPDLMEPIVVVNLVGSDRPCITIGKGGRTAAQTKIVEHR
ncbi:hypothetical protein ACLOJK_037585 [Asimina triloba]